MDTRILSAQHIGRRIGERWIWRDLSFELHEGDRLAATGPTGSGKSLLLRALAGLDAIEEGHILHLGHPLTAGAMPAYRARVMYLPQRPELADASVEDNLRLPFRFAIHKDLRFDRGRVAELLQRLGRDERFLASPAKGLSGGEGQLVSLARALLLQPRVLLLDEFTASMDRETVARAEGLVQEWLSANAERALVLSSHAPAQLDRLATQHVDVRGAA